MKARIFSLIVLIMLSNFAQGSGWVGGSCNSGTGTYNWDDGNRYEGECRNGTFNGQGVLYHKSG